MSTWIIFGEFHDFDDSRAIFSLVMLVIFTLLFVAQMFFHLFKGISPLQVRLIKQALK